jgi:hypothetical protein
MKKQWPVLSYEKGRQTYDTLQLFTQMAGKIKLATMPWVNHSWNVTLHITTSGFTTQTMPYRHMNFQIDFDLIEHMLKISTSKGDLSQFSLEDISGAGFYNTLFTALKELGIEIDIMTLPSEIVDPIPFELDELHNTYEREHASAFHLALLQIQEVFMIHRSSFSGKSSPIHFFWGGFDLSLAYFSGKRAPHHPGKMVGMPDWVLQDAYSHEVRDAGFWSGNDGLPEAAFYCYLYPEPNGYKSGKVEPAEAYYHQTLGEYILPYSAVQESEDPQEKLLAFLNSTYQIGATLAGWDPDFTVPVPKA